MWSGRKSRSNTGPGVVNFWRREVGDLNSRAFATLTNASEDLVMRLKIIRKLNKHRGCVNTVSFNANGNVLISGSDDRLIMLWDWDMGTRRLAFHSGHSNNVFQAKFMPFADDRTIVTCAADGEVRYAQIADGGRVDIKLLATHEGRVHKLAVEPGSPHVFYSCAEDGLVQRFDLRGDLIMPLLTCTPMHHPLYINLSAIVVDPRNPNFFAVAGSDELVRLYDIRKCIDRQGGESQHDLPIDCFCPPHLLGKIDTGVTGLAFSEQGELLASYCNDKIYLFTKDQGLGRQHLLSSPRASLVPKDGKEHFGSLVPIEYFGHRNCDTMKGVGFHGPNCEYVVSGSDCGRIFIWRKTDGLLLRAMEGDKYVVNCIESHPHLPILASSGIEDDIKMWESNAAEPYPPINMNEVLDYVPQYSLSYYFYGALDEMINEDENDEDDEDDDDDNMKNEGDKNRNSDDSSDDEASFQDGDSDDGSHDNDSGSDGSEDFTFMDDCMEESLSDNYLASGHYN